jgi:histidine triad (HIT) family protein
MSQSCLFCRVISREVPATFLHEDDQLVAIEDINPQAPLHALVIPRRHISTLNDLVEPHDALVGAMLRRAAALAAARGFSDRGYRTVFNCNREAGQTVYHIHLHVLGGRSLGWPPG